jgi:hypothetical protein
MKFVLLIYQRTAPLPSSNRWQALPCAEQKATCADDAQINVTSSGAVKVRPAEQYW